MSYTENKLNTLRRLLLGPLFDECKNSPYGVSRDRIEEHVNNLKKDGCIGDCSVDEFVKMCQMKSHIPSCYNDKDRDCVEGWFGKQKGPATVGFTNYKNSKYFENLPDDDDDDDEDEDEEEKKCSVCGDDEDLEENFGSEREGYKDEFKKLEKMSCPHYAHKSCLIKLAKGLNKDNAFCPLCKFKYPITEVPMPIVSNEQKRQNALLKTIKDSLATGISLKEIAEMNLTTISGLIRGLVMNVKTFAEAIGMSEEELTNQMYTTGDEFHPRVIKEYYSQFVSQAFGSSEKLLHKEYEVKWDGDTPVYHGYYKEYHPNGKLKSEATYRNGIKEGKEKQWHKNGQLSVQVSYINGEMEGEYKEWHNNGQLGVEVTYINGEKEGEYKEWYNNGKLAVEVTYKNGRREGEYKRWYSNGQLASLSFHKDGKREGEYKQWYENGQLWTQEYYKNGKGEGEHKEWYENGQIRFNSRYKEGIIYGEFTGWSDDGRLIKKLVYNDKGELISYKKFGKHFLSQEGNFSYTDTRKTGTIKFYDKNGNLKKERHIDEPYDEGEYDEGDYEEDDEEEDE